MTARRCTKLVSALAPWGLAFATLAGAGPAQAGEALTADSFRDFCGFFLALDEPVNRRCEKDSCKKIRSLPEKKQFRAAAKLLGRKTKDVRASVRDGRAVGANCDEVGKVYEAKTGAALQKAFGGRLDLFVLDYSDPEFVVAAVTWKGLNKKKLEEEAATIAHLIATHAPITKTIAIRAVHPKAVDKDDPKAVWFDGKTNVMRASRIDPKKIAVYAATRYMGLFDDVVKSDAMTNKLMKYDSRRRRWMDAPPDALKPKDAKDKKKG